MKPFRNAYEAIKRLLSKIFSKEEQGVENQPGPKAEPTPEPAPAPEPPKPAPTPEPTPKPDDSTIDTNVKTGDDTPIALLWSLMILSLAGIGVVVTKRNRKKK